MLLGVMEAEKILLFTPTLRWYIEHGFKITAYDDLIKYKPVQSFDWFREEVTQAQREADKNKNKMIRGETTNLKGNSFYGKMVEDIACRHYTTFTANEKDINDALRSPFFEDLEEIGEASEIQERKRKVGITRPYQCGIAVYELAKLRMLEFYYDFLDKYIDRKEFEYLHMDTH